MKAIGCEASYQNRQGLEDHRWAHRSLHALVNPLALPRCLVDARVHSVLEKQQYFDLDMHGQET